MIVLNKDLTKYNVKCFILSLKNTLVIPQKADFKRPTTPKINSFEKIFMQSLDLASFT